MYGEAPLNSPLSELPQSRNNKVRKLSDLYSAKVSEDNQGALGMGAMGQDSLIESSGSLNDI